MQRKIDLIVKIIKIATIHTDFSVESSYYVALKTRHNEKAKGFPKKIDTKVNIKFVFAMRVVRLATGRLRSDSERTANIETCKLFASLVKHRLKDVELLTTTQVVLQYIVSAEYKPLTISL